MTDQLTLAVNIIARSKKNVSKKDGLQKKLVIIAVLQFIWKTFFDPRLQIQANIFICRRGHERHETLTVYAISGHL